MNTESQVLNVPIEDIIPNRFQPRLNFDETSLKELASSIKEHGIIQPLVLRRLDDKYEIIAGERRYKAAKLAGLTSVPAIISTMDDRKSAEVAIVENVQRKDLTSIEEAKSYKALLDKGYLTQEELAKKMGLSQSAISNKLRLLSLSPKVQTAIMEGKISERHARSLLQLATQEEQDRWLDKIINERITVRELDKKLKEYNNREGADGDDIPIINMNPNIAEIKEKAVDIFSPKNTTTKVEEVKEDTQQVNKPIPNKFFNYLEDEEANMNVYEPTPSTTSSETEEVPLDNPQPVIDPLAPVVDITHVEDNNENKEEKDVTSIEEVKEEVVEEPPKEEKKESQEKSEENKIENNEEEIEMLDFLAPSEEEKVEEKESTPTIEVKEEIVEEPSKEEKKEPQEKEEKNPSKPALDEAIKMIDQLEDDLRNKGFKVSILKENKEKEINYTFTISKE